MRMAGFLLILAALWPSAVAAQEVLTLEGSFRQGGLVTGRTQPGATLELDGKPVRVSPDGVFLFGFGRNAKPNATLKIRLPDGHEEVQTVEVGQREYRVQRIDGLPPKKVTPPPEAIEQIVREREKKAEAFKQDLPEPWFRTGWIWPAEGRISGVYGSQRILNGEPRRPHYGVDVAGPEGTPVVAPADGKVVLAMPEMYFEGNAVFLDHGHGLKSVFMHLSALDVAEGQLVRRGERIGAVGATGRVTGAHLHWAVYWFRLPLDPAFLVSERPGSRE
jgi:murein DD-endopeptidase MepM/ murein hydrolase activator NlpD